VEVKMRTVKLKKKYHNLLIEIEVSLLTVLTHIKKNTDLSVWSDWFVKDDVKQKINTIYSPKQLLDVIIAETEKEK